MRRALLVCVVLAGCAVHRKDAAPSAAPGRSYDAEEKSSPAGGDAPTGTSAPPPVTPVMPGEGGASGTVVMPDKIRQAQISFDDASKAFSAAGSDCAQLCKALYSMTNATERLCALTDGTTEQTRCLDARERLDAARTRLKSSCPTC